MVGETISRGSGVAVLTDGKKEAAPLGLVCHSRPQFFTAFANQMAVHGCNDMAPNQVLPLQTQFLLKAGASQRSFVCVVEPDRPRRGLENERIRHQRRFGSRTVGRSVPTAQNVEKDERREHQCGRSHTLSTLGPSPKLVEL